MLLIKIDKQNTIPIFNQVLNQLKNMIENNILKFGDKLPSTRKLSKNLDVSRSTVYRAYEELWAIGYIESKQGSYSTIREISKINKSKIDETPSLINWSKISSLRQIDFEIPENKNQDKKIINFVSLSPDPDLFPINELKKCINKSLLGDAASLLGYGSSLGYKPLREYISCHMHKHGITSTTNEIIITNGTQNSLELILKLFVTDKTNIAIESPSYSSAIALFKLHKVNLIEIPLTNNGIDLELFEKKANKGKIDYLYTMPNFQNPTGITTSQSHREKLYNICKENNIIIIEDGFEEEMKYFGKAIQPIKAIDNHGIVIYLGTFSKVLAPGLRTAWIVAPANCIDNLDALKRLTEISGHNIDQAAISTFCSSQQYDIHLKRIHRIYRKRMQVALKSIKLHLTHKNISYTKPNGGYSIWFEINVDNTLNRVIELIHCYGVKVSSGDSFFPRPTSKICFRISIAHAKENEIENGIILISKAFQNIIKL